MSDSFIVDRTTIYQSVAHLGGNVLTETHLLDTYSLDLILILMNTDKNGKT